MDKIWLQSYPAGVPAEIDVDEFRSIGDLFERGVRRFASRTAYVCMGKSMTYAELDRLSARFASYLQGELKLPVGTRVALMMPNLLQYPVALFGALRAGYTVVNVNPLYTPRELIHQINDSGATTIFVLATFAHVYECYNADQPLLGPGQLCEITYEHLAADPLGQMRRVYAELGIGDFARAEEGIARELPRLRAHQPARHVLTSAQQAAVASRWSGYIARYGYRLPG